MHPTVIIIGGGASGLAAALAAARGGAKIVVLEKGRSLGRKVLASGGGRCNLSNRDIRPERYHGGNRVFVQSILSGFGAGQAREFFEGLGLMLIEEPDGRVFPRCGRAKAVVDVFHAALNELGVDIRLNTGVKKLERAKGQWKATLDRGEGLAADSVVLCCGGAAHPQLGGGEGGYGLAASLGHSIVPATPALVPLRMKESWVKRLAGIRAEVSLRAESEGRLLSKARGELLFTAYGISGPAALDISREAVLALAHGSVACSLDLFPEFSEERLLEFLKKRAAGLGRRTLKGFLTGMLPDTLPDVFLERHGFSAHERAEALKEAGLLRLCRALKDWRFELAGPRPWQEAMASAGGVSLSEVDPRTLESKKAPRLFLAGELLDVDGDSGGFSLHFAWASGLLAGAAASRK
ncbi:MAG: aminoacetone oxidase family FAD-binding enzyme [Elusimicrobia bacterium]|nr:aminoacetone oxidase family FAD-binding enzyme [Elusimicrobiota bacterium]